VAISPLHPFLTTGLSTWGHFPPHPVSLLGHTSSPYLLLPIAQTSFDPNLYPYKYPSNLIPAILLLHMTFEDGTECTETSAHKIQMPGITQKEEYNLFLIIALVPPLFFVYYTLLIR
jgi:hypothetical protein